MMLRRAGPESRWIINCVDCAQERVANKRPGTTKRKFRFAFTGPQDGKKLTQQQQSLSATLDRGLPTGPVAAGRWLAVELGILPGGQNGSTQKSLKTGPRAHRFLADERSVPRLAGCQPVETADCQSARGGVARTAGPL